MKKLLIISCIVIVALSSVVLVNPWINVSDNSSKNFTFKFNSKLSSEFNNVVNIALADIRVKEKVEALEKRFGNISATVISSESDSTFEVRFTPDFNPHEERKDGLYGIRCVIDMETKKVINIKEFNISPLSVPTPPQDPSLWAPKLRLYLNNDKEEFVHEFVQGEKIIIYLENIGNETITLPNPAPWEVIVLPMLDAEIESRLHCSPEETVYAKFPKIYPDMYNITDSFIYKPEVEQTAVLIHPNETLTWTWDQKLDDGNLLKPGHYRVVLRGVDVRYVEQTIFYVLPKQ
ncbi:hypothetical protein E3E22_03030 [Thermococcus sp. MV5]|uniref:hypothetical protein n=1 Tax=Thermococcus sp. MV5 TaxID=1638272 RepID=UPI00143C824B|nr:hypothetical protein [Thermococcus sp. MV5]NJE25609.1 hypothetical protein [Thermococcus sp. MV5]